VTERREMAAGGASAGENAAGWTLAAVAALLIGAGLHLWYLVSGCPLDLSGDEAHYWEWARRLDYGYYSKGPLVALIIAAGRAVLGELSNRWLGNETLAVRGSAIALSVLSGLGIFVWTARVTRSARTAFVCVALLATVPVFAAGSMLMTIDAPLMVAWIWALVCVDAGLRGRGLWAWPAAGGCIALGLLAKFNMLLIYPVVALGITFGPGLRGWWTRPGPWIAAAVGLLGLVPIVAWNAQHDWVSFRHVAGQAGVSGGAKLFPLGPVEYAAGQAAVTNPLWFALLVGAAAWAVRRRKGEAIRGEGLGDDAVSGAEGAAPRAAAGDPATTLGLFATLVPLGVFLAFSFITKIQPNWPVVAYATAPGLIAAWAAARWRAWAPGVRFRFRAVAWAAVVVGLAANAVLHHSEWITPALAWWTRGAPPWNLTPVANVDPTARLRGWRELGAAAGESCVGLRQRHPDAFVVADDYQVASQLAFYMPGSPRVYCVQAAMGDRRSQYDVWANPLRDVQDFRGRACLYVGRIRPELSEGESAPFPGLTRDRVVEHMVRGARMAVWSISHCEAFAGFREEFAGDSPKY
jgi:4-amino-4-deoxy-L-arabinose transferase-like glycosyltransferase